MEQSNRELVRLDIDSFPCLVEAQYLEELKGAVAENWARRE